MKLPLTAATIMALALIACNGSRESTQEIGPKDTLIETPEVTEPSPSDAPLAPKSPENTLVETLDYTGVLISKDGASELSHVFGDSTEFWEPSIDDVSRAEACIRQFLTSAQDNPQLDTSQKVNAPVILENLEEYRRQYVGIVVDGEKRIWCNAFRPEDEFPNWQRLPVYVLDGGDDFWEIEYIPVKDECINFYVHGEA